jgi:hypothetical protein
MINRVLSAVGEKRDTEETQRRLIQDAFARGLDHAEIAEEFNQRKVRQLGRPPWTERNVGKACKRLGLLKDEPEQKRTAGTERAATAASNTTVHTTNDTAAVNGRSFTRRHVATDRHRHGKSQRISAGGKNRGRSANRKSPQPITDGEITDTGWEEAANK